MNKNARKYFFKGLDIHMSNKDSKGEDTHLPHVSFLGFNMKEFYFS